MQSADRAVPPRPREPRPRGEIGAGADREGTRRLIARADRLGVVIAGGRSSRYGSDKAFVVWRGNPLIEWSRRLLDPWCGRVAVSGKDWRQLPAIPDRPRWGLGPMGGIASAMIHARLWGFQSVLTIAVDTPDVPESVLAELCAHLPSYCPDSPVLAHWPAEGGDAISARLENGETGKVETWAQRLKARPVPAPGLMNVNRPADLTP